MFKKFINSIMTVGMSFILASSYWDFIGSGNSLLFFGEPTYPSTK